MALDRSWFNSLVNDDGSGLVGTIWRKEDVGALMNAIDSELKRVEDQVHGSVVQYFAGVSGVMNDVELVPYCRTLIFDNDQPLTITGLKAGYPGQQLVIMSLNAAPVYLAERDPRSLRTNWLDNSVATGPTPLAPYFGRASYIYDATQTFWRLLAHIQGGALPIPYAAGIFGSYNASGTPVGSWNVAPADVLDLTYMVLGKSLVVNLAIAATSTLSGAAGATILGLTLPMGYRFARNQRSPSISYYDAGTITPLTGEAVVNVNQPLIAIAKDLNFTTPYVHGPVGVVGIPIFELL